jgi:hypothetical protein
LRCGVKARHCKIMEAPGVQPFRWMRPIYSFDATRESTGDPPHLLARPLPAPSRKNRSACARSALVRFGAPAWSSSVAMALIERLWRAAISPSASQNSGSSRTLVCLALTLRLRAGICLCWSERAALGMPRFCQNVPRPHTIVCDGQVRPKAAGRFLTGDRYPEARPVGMRGSWCSAASLVGGSASAPLTILWQLEVSWGRRCSNIPAPVRFASVASGRARRAQRKREDSR